MYNSKILAFGKHVPDNIVTNDDISKIVDTSDEWIFSRTGISERRISSGDDTSDMAIKLAYNLLEKTKMLPEEIDLIIIATISPDYLMPSTACIVQGAIGAKNAFAFDISAACSGFVYALSTADKFIRSGKYKNAMVIGAEVLSKAVSWEDRGTCILFGDGAGGVIITGDEKENSIVGEDLHSDGNGWKALKSGKIPNKNYLHDGGQVFSDLEMDGRDVFIFATKVVPKSISKLVLETGTSMEDIKYIVPHQANVRIVNIIAKKLGVSMEKFYMNLQRFGNTSSASIPIAIAEMFERKLVSKGDKVLICGFGGGLTWGSMLLQL